MSSRARHYQLHHREREIADQLRADIDRAQRRPSLLEDEDRATATARMVRQAREKARLEHQVIAEAEEAELTKARDRARAQWSAVKTNPNVVSDANESARATEVYAYLSRATDADLDRLVDEEHAGGGSANARVLDALAAETLERLKAVAPHQRDGSPIDRLARRTRNIRDNFRKGQPAATGADIVAPHERKLRDAQARHQFFRRAVGLE